MKLSILILSLIVGVLAVRYLHADDDSKDPKKADLKASLTPMEYKVTMQEGTEPPFNNEYYNNHTPGIYVSVVSGEPLFSSKDKFDSGTGWPSFTKPIAAEAVTGRSDNSLGMDRREIRSAKADTHLGHLFDDGPPPSHNRYCINSAALKFIPADKLEEAGFADLAKSFTKETANKESSK